MHENDCGADKGAERSADETKPKETPTTNARPFATVTDEPRPEELARELGQKPAVHAVAIRETCRSVLIEITLTASHDRVPVQVVRPIYARRLAVVDISSVTAGSHTRIEARPAGWSA